VGWRDRDYNRGGGADDYLSNPAAILGFSVPFGTWFGVRVRLHFWLILTFVFALADMIRGMFLLVVIGMAILTMALLFHDFLHKFFAQWLGGRHDEFMLWPAGGLIFPTIAPGPWPMFVAYVGPLAVHAAIGVGCALALGIRLPLNPLAGLGMQVIPPGGLNFREVLIAFGLDNWLLLLVNLLPYYWFDGGCLLQSLIWPMAGAYQAINITCIVGMVLAVPMFFLSLMGQSFLGMVLWVLLFSASYTRRRQLQASGTGELEDAIAWSAQDTGRAGARGRKWMQPGFAKKVAKRNAQARREREKIDQILAKVSQKGMHSLNWLERRALRKATERQKKGLE
jgi:hypothetical protein